MYRTSTQQARSTWVDFVCADGLLLADLAIGTRALEHSIAECAVTLDAHAHVRNATRATPTHASVTQALNAMATDICEPEQLQQCATLTQARHTSIGIFPVQSHGHGRLASSYHFGFSACVHCGREEVVRLYVGVS